MIQTRWIDECSEHRLVIHGWAEHCEEWIRKRVQRSDSDFAAVSAPRQTTADNGRPVRETLSDNGAVGSPPLPLPLPLPEPNPEPESGNLPAASPPPTESTLPATLKPDGGDLTPQQEEIDYAAAKLVNLIGPERGKQGWKLQWLQDNLLLMMLDVQATPGLKEHNLMPALKKKVISWYRQELKNPGGFKKPAVESFDERAQGGIQRWLEKL